MSLAVGLCGCGNMGSAIAARLAVVGELAVFDVDAARAASLARELGVSVAATVAELGSRAQVVVLSLPHPDASREVVGLLAGHMAAGGIVVETSTVLPDDVRTLGRLCDDAGLRLVEAAILTGVPQMRSGDSILLVGGDDDAVAAAAPVLESLAARRLLFGALGSGMAAKVANNAVSHAVMVVLLEAAAMAQACGVSPEVFAELLADPDAGLLRPLAHRLRERVLGHDFDGGMPTEAALKDSVLALRLAREADVPLFAIQGAHRPYELAMEAGLGRLDYASLALLWEEWTGRRFGVEEGEAPA